MAGSYVFTNSRYSAKTVSVDGQVIRIKPGISLSNTNYDDNIVIRTKSGDRLDSLSYALYGTTDFYWVIAEFNNIKYFATDLKELDTIIAPSKETLYGIILPSLGLN